MKKFLCALALLLVTCGVRGEIQYSDIVRWRLATKSYVDNSPAATGAVHTIILNSVTYTGATITISGVLTNNGVGYTLSNLTVRGTFVSTNADALYDAKGASAAVRTSITNGTILINGVELSNISALAQSAVQAITFNGGTLTGTNITINALTNGMNYTNLAGFGDIVASNTSAFYLSSNPSNYVTASITNGLLATNGVTSIVYSNASDFATTGSVAGAIAHVGTTNNPHSVTAAQAGADPTGSASGVQSNLTAHVEATGTNVHGLGTASTSAVDDFVPVNSLVFTNGTTLRDGVLNGTNGVYFAVGTNNYWILF